MNAPVQIYPIQNNAQIGTIRSLVFFPVKQKIISLQHSHVKS
jgi:hypothetical protein